MKKKKALIASLVFGAAMAAAPAMAGLDLGFSINNGQLSNLYLSAGDYYQEPQREVVVVQREVPEDEAPVVFFLARRAHCDPDRIIRMRHRGYNWWRITMSLGLDPNIYYVPVDEDRIGPPYGRAYGYYRHRGPRYLSDPDIVNMVNLRFISSYYGVPPREIIERRERGENFARIEREYSGRGRHHGWKDEGHEGEGHEHGQGRGHGEDHGHGRGHGHGHDRGDED